MNALLETIATGGSEGEVQSAAQKVPDLNQSQNDEGLSQTTIIPLTAAVLANNIEALKVLLELGAQTDVYCTVPDMS